MRFKSIKKFSIDELLLDEGNYRFQGAINQKACIQKIFLSSPQNFKNLMKSVAEDDLGELLLVYQHKGKNIVLDGNRRLAALKVLHDPKLAPNESIVGYAEKILEEHRVDFKNIQAQVSDDKGLIFKTVYERHAAGSGKSRIGWSAYGAARFTYDQKLEDGKDWYSIALLLETEKQFPEWTEFIDGDYSHEVFRRLVRSALEKNIISQTIFSDKDKRIKKTADKALLKDAVSKVNAFLKSMSKKDIGLSRDGVYADKKAVDAYIEAFPLSPDNRRLARPGSAPAKTLGKKGGEQDNVQPSSAGATNPKNPSGYGINKSDVVEARLRALGSKKLISLYTSLCTVSLRSHPQLMYVGAWSFFEAVSALMGKTEGTSFPSYFDSFMNTLTLLRQQKKDFALSLKDISDRGNATKHSGTYYPTNADALVGDFEMLEPLILEALNKLIHEKSKKAA